MSTVLPDGYIALSARAAQGVGLMSLRVPLEAALGAGSFYAYAERAANARPLAGRGVAYAVSLPGDAARVVVRRSRHGGFFAALTGDRFTAPTRAPYELDTALRLTALGVRTPEVVAFATYPAGILRRADVVTREIPGSADLAAVLAEPMSEDRRRAVLAAVAQLIAEGRSLDAVIDTLTAEYETSRQDIEREVTDLVQTLVSKGLVVRRESQGRE